MIGGSMIILVGAFVIFLGAIAVVVFFLLNLQNTIASCSKENQAMEPGMVWLLLIPLFNFYWIFHQYFGLGKVTGR